MILTDTGPLIAIFDKGEPEHERCVSALQRVTLPLVSTWPVFTEAMYLLGDAGGWTAQERLWRLFHRGDLRVLDLSAPMIDRCESLMRTYRNLPMDLADASLVSLAEARGWSRVFTLDSHFHAYRLLNRRSLTILPS